MLMQWSRGPKLGLEGGFGGERNANCQYAQRRDSGDSEKKWGLTFGGGGMIEKQRHDKTHEWKGAASFG